MPNSQIILEEFQSSVLENNPLGDPATRRIPVYLPPGYKQGEQRFPVVYLLVGFAGRGRKLLNDSLWSENIQERMDRLVLDGAVQPMILVMPDCSTRYGGSQYLNSSALGHYRDHLLELVAYVDDHYRTRSEREARAVAGHSSGGYGALTLGMQHPEIFGLVADHSGDIYFELVYKNDFPAFLNYYQKAGESGLKQLLADPGLALRQGVSFSALNLVAMSACYSPNPDSPLGFDLPLDPTTGELLQDVWQRWLAQDPVNMVEQHAEALRSLKLLYFDCGRQDEYHMLYGCRILAQRLSKLDIPYQYEEFEGGHSGTSYRYDVSLKAISEAIA